MKEPYRIATAIVAGLFCSTMALADGWVNYVNETSTRMPTGAGQNNSATSTNDPEEKDYAWGDVDNDGDIDLVCVRKQPFTSTGKKINVLFMNEGGVLIDRTSTYAEASDVGGDLGALRAFSIIK